MNNSTIEDLAGLDSQCLTYLIDCMNGVEEPTDPLAEERKALARIFFYTDRAFFVSETVLKEVAKIRTTDRRSLHEKFVQVSIIDPPVADTETVANRASLFFLAHPHKNDCNILAEAEDLKLTALLSYDFGFLKRLKKASSTVKLLRPSEYWISLGIVKGSNPVRIPYHMNPLSKQAWWKW